MTESGLLFVNFALCPNQLAPPTLYGRLGGRACRSRTFQDVKQQFLDNPEHTAADCRISDMLPRPSPRVAAPNRSQLPTPGAGPLFSNVRYGTLFVAEGQTGVTRPPPEAAYLSPSSLGWT